MKETKDTEVKKINVSTALSDKRLDVALVTAGFVESRSQGQKLIEKGNVSINGNKQKKSSYKLQDGEVLEVRVEKKPDIDLVPYDFPLNVVFEDEDVIVIDKPAGLVVHPACGHPDDTLINALIAYNTSLSEGTESFRPGLVHRLDKGTSGLLVLAKNDSSHNKLAKQFLDKTIHRRYWALIFGTMKAPTGTIETQIYRDPNNRKRFLAGDENKGKNAITHFVTLGEGPHFSLLELTLETGRTHQIRVHVSHQGHPIAGDEIYGGKNRAKNLKSQTLKAFIKNMDRFALHAKQLGFKHPRTNEDMFFDSNIPDDLIPLYEMTGLSEYVR